MVVLDAPALHVLFFAATLIDARPLDCAWPRLRRIAHAEKGAAFLLKPAAPGGVLNAPRWAARCRGAHPSRRWSGRVLSSAFCPLTIVV